MTLSESDVIEWLCQREGLVTEAVFYAGNVGVIITRDTRTDLRACYHVSLGDAPRIHSSLTADEVGEEGVVDNFLRRVTRAMGK